MTIDRTRKEQMKLAKVPLLLTLAIIALLAGCGGGGGGSTSTLSTTASGGATTQPSTAQPKKKGGGKPQSTKPQQPNGSAPTASAPLPNQGTRAVAPGVPTAKGGDNSIQAYGVEADSAERVQLATIAKGYLDAQAAGRWAAACSYLDSKLRSNLASLAASSPASVGRGCAGGIATLLSTATPAALQSAARIHVLSLRVKGDQAFVIYRDGAGKPFNLPLIRQRGDWRLSATLGVALVL
jgi:hypothetical protein